MPLRKDLDPLSLKRRGIWHHERSQSAYRPPSARTMQTETSRAFERISRPSTRLFVCDAVHVIVVVRIWSMGWLMAPRVRGRTIKFGATGRACGALSAQQLECAAASQNSPYATSY